MLRRLSTFCSEKRPVTLTLGHPPRILAGRFAAMSMEGGFVELELTNRPEGIELGSDWPCTVVYRDGPRHQVLAGSTLPHGGPSFGLPRVRIALPMHSAPVELRSSWRIPVGPDCGLRLRLHCNGTVLTPSPIDISPGGILADFTECEDYVPTEDEVKLELDLGDLHAELEVMPQRRSETGFVLYFSQVLRGLRHGRLVVPAALRPILDKLENRWFDSGRAGRFGDRLDGTS